MPLDQNHDDVPVSGLMSFGAHLDELRRRLVWALAVPAVFSCVAFMYSDWIIDFIKLPLMTALSEAGQPPVLQVLSPSEVVVAKLQLSFWAAAFFAIPWILWQLWSFVSPGLYAQERRYARFLVPFSTALVIAGLALFYMALPYLLGMLIGFAEARPRLVNNAAPAVVSALPSIPVLESDPTDAKAGEVWLLKSDGQIYVAVDTARPDGKLEVHTVPTQRTGSLSQQYRLSEYIDFVLTFGAAIAIAFQMPVAVLLLGWLGILDLKTLRKYRKYAFFICTIAAAVITPTVDLVSMLVLLIPLYLLYELGIILLQIAPARAVAEGGVVSNAWNRMVGVRKHGSRYTDGHEGEE